MAPAPPALPFSAFAEGVRLAVRLTPKAGRARIDGLRATPEGPVLAVAVTAPPEDGKANAALEALLAKALHLPKSSVRVSQGGKSRNKTVTLEGDPAALVAALRTLLQDTDSHG